MYTHSMAFVLLKLMCYLCEKSLHPQVACLDIYKAFLVTLTLLTESKGFRGYVLFEAYMLRYLGYNDELIQNFIEHWQDPKRIFIDEQWKHHGSMFKRIGKSWNDWHKTREQVYAEIFLS